VAVCPTGIDIRDGNQLECIGCGLCIDACNRIMERVGRPPELITYDTIRRSDARARGERTHYRLIRPRTMIYATLLVIVGTIMAWSLLTRTTVELHAIGDRAPLYVTLSDGDIRNGYTIRILNKVLQTRDFILTVEDLPRPGLSMVGGPSQVQSLEIIAAPDAVTTERIFIQVPADALGAATTDFRFVLKEVGEYGERVEIHEKFHGPEPGQ
jgi:polyferredoxin